MTEHTIVTFYGEGCIHFFKYQNYFMMRKTKFLPYFCAFLLFLGSCINESIEPETASQSSESVQISTAAQEQLDGIFTFWSTQFPNADLQPISIGKPKQIMTEVDKSALVQELSASESRYAYYDGVNMASMKVFALGSLTDSEASMRSAAQKSASLIKTGQRYVTINWKYKGEEFSTPFVYNEKGFVYEPIAASIAVKKDLLSTARTTDWIHNFELTWIWGGKRGHVKIRHEIDCNGSSLTYQDGWSDAYMQLGSAEAEIITNGSTSSKSCTSWGYAWGTSPISVNVSTDWGASGTYNGVGYQGKINASISGTLGSSGKATGFNILQCY